MEATLGELRAFLEQVGMQARLRGDSSRPVCRVATLEDAISGDVSFLSNPKYEKMLQTTRASAIVVKPDVAAPEHLDLIQVEDPYAAITALIVKLHGYRQHRRLSAEQVRGTIHPTARIGENSTIHPGATIDEGVVIGRNAIIYAGCYVGPRCRLGDNVLLYPNVVLYDDTIVGSRVAIHANTVVGEDGLGYAPVGGKWVKIPQIGHVEIEDDVEIGANCAIDRATLGRTRIGRGSKFSNLIAIGHGTQIGEDCMLVAQVGIAGSVTVGKHVTLAGQAGVVGHIRIGDCATVGAKAGVTRSVADGETVLGAPAIPIHDMRRQVAHVAHLPDLKEAVKRLERRVAELEAQLEIKTP
jgi:UDP-3-O-[3-hydroxymyristoyl] glucosamine N-acyltransferase